MESHPQTLIGATAVIVVVTLSASLYQLGARHTWIRRFSKDGVTLELVSQTFASWNRMDRFVRQIEALRRAASH